MIKISKIFRFEAAHAIHNYPGNCAHIHGHSYELHVTVRSKQSSDTFIGGLGIIIDFKDLKSLDQQGAIKALDHKLILSKAYMTETRGDFASKRCNWINCFFSSCPGDLVFIQNFGYGSASS